MIQQNDYTDETIHVTNWLLLSGEVDLAELAAKAAYMNAGDDWTDHTGREDTQLREEGLRARLANELQVALEQTVNEAMPDGDAHNLFRTDDIPGDWTMPTNAEEYGGIGALIRPFIGAGVQRVNLYEVASLIYEHRPELLPRVLQAEQAAA